MVVYCTSRNLLLQAKDPNRGPVQRSFRCLCEYLQQTDCLAIHGSPKLRSQSSYGSDCKEKTDLLGKNG